MSSETICPSCSHRLEVNLQAGRTHVPCPGCGVLLTVVQTAKGPRLLLPPGHTSAKSPEKHPTSTPIPSGPPRTPSSPQPASRPISVNTPPVSQPAVKQISIPARSRTGVVGWVSLVSGALVLLIATSWGIWRASQPTGDAANSKPASASSEANPPSPSDTIAKEIPPQTPPTPPPAVRKVLSTRELIQKVEPSVCRIRAGANVGSGFVVGPQLICTNAHVLGLEEESRWAVEFPSRSGLMFRKVDLAYALEGVDLVLLRVADLPGDFLALPTIERAQIQKGERLVVIGSPGGMENVVTEGIVGSFQEIDHHTYIQLSVAVNPGNSGGPALNEYGEAAGVVTLKAVQEGIGMAIPSDEVERALKEFSQLTPLQIETRRERWKGRQAGSKLLIASREAVLLSVLRLTMPDEGKIQIWNHRYGEAHKLSEQIRRKSMDRVQNDLLARLEELFLDASQALNAPESDPAVFVQQLEAVSTAADALEVEMKKCFGTLAL